MVENGKGAARMSKLPEVGHFPSILANSPKPTGLKILEGDVSLQSEEVTQAISITIWFMYQGMYLVNPNKEIQQNDGGNRGT